MFFDEVWNSDCRIKFVVNADGTVSVDDEVVKDNIVIMTDEAIDLTELPNTGSTGTRAMTLFSLMAMIVTAVAVYRRCRKMI